MLKTKIILFFCLAQFLVHGQISITNEKTTDNLKICNDAVVVDGSQGLMVLEDYTKGEWVILNQNKSIYKAFDFGQPESNSYYEILDSITSNIDLFAYKPDYGLLIIQANIEKDGYSIETKSGEIKLVAISNTNFKFYTWEEFLLSDQYVSISERYLFSGELLKFYQSPSDTSDQIIYNTETNELNTINANEVNGEWIKIKRESLDDETQNPMVGWTKWRKGNRRIVNFWYLL